MQPQVLTIAEIKAQYPDQWVLVGNPQMREDALGTIIKKIMSGIVLFHSKDKHYANLGKQNPTGFNDYRKN